MSVSRGNIPKSPTSRPTSRPFLKGTIAVRRHFAQKKIRLGQIGYPDAEGLFDIAPDATGLRHMPGCISIFMQRVENVC